MGTFFFFRITKSHFKVSSIGTRYWEACILILQDVMFVCCNSLKFHPKLRDRTTSSIQIDLKKPREDTWDITARNATPFASKDFYLHS